jgi:Tol biopolymer transport system component
MNRLDEGGRTMRRILVFALLAAALAAAAANAAVPGPHAKNGKIVTNSDNQATGEEQVYTVDPNGKNLHLAATSTEVGQWSPNGRMFLLVGDAGLAEFNPDTGSSHALALPDGLYPGLHLYCGTWSPDGVRLACETFGDDVSRNGIYTVRAANAITPTANAETDGGDLRQVTSEPNGDDCPSDYSPNGKRLVATLSPADAPQAIYTMKADGTHRRQITPDGMNFNFCNGSWSPRGNEIVFSAHVPDDAHSSIWVVHADGSGLRELPVQGCGGPNSDPAAIGCFNPTWSPDGKKIVFARRVASGAADLYTVNANGGGLFQVTNTPTVDETGGDWGTHPTQ